MDEFIDRMWYEIKEREFFIFYSFNDSLGFFFKTTLLKYDLYTINLSILNEQSNDF